MRSNSIEIILATFFTFTILPVFAHNVHNIKKMPVTALSVTATVTNNSYETYGTTFINLNLGYGVFYNGAVEFTVSGGSGPYTYQIVTPYRYQQYGYFTGLAPGSYDFIITDNTGQTFDTTIVIMSVYPLPAVTLSNIVYPSSCRSSDGSFTLTGTGGTPPYLFSIDGGVTFTTSNVFTNLTQGYYPLLLIKDANGQLNFTGFNINFFSGNFFACGCCPFDVLSDLYGAESCGASEGGFGVASIGGKAPIQFSTDGINYFTGTVKYLPNGDSQYTYNFINLASGLYHIYGKDANGLISVSAIPVLEVCTISISYVEVDAACKQNDGSITVIAVNGTAPYSYTLDGKNFQASNVFTGLGVGHYTIWVKDANGLENSIGAVVFDKCPIVSAVGTMETCGQNNGTITATGIKGTTPYQYSIDGINFQSSNVFNNLSSGNYTVTLKDINGFTSTTAVFINNNCLQLNLATTNTTCSNKNGSITITGSNGTPPYQYSIDGINFQTASQFNNLASGTYTISIKDAAGLNASADTTITDAPAPQINTINSPASCTNTGGIISIIRSGGTGPYLYSNNNGTSFQNDSIFNNLDSGRYLIVVKDANGCSATDTTSLMALPTPKISLGNDTTLCTGASLLLSAQSSAGLSYQWQDNSSLSTYSVTTAGIYFVKVSNQYCSSSDSINVRFRPLPVFSLGSDTSLCAGKNILLEPVLPKAAYLWSNGSIANTISVTVSGLYWLQVSDSGCVKADSIAVNFRPAPVVHLGNDTSICTGQSILLDATNNNSTYYWQDGSAGPTYTVMNAGIFTVKVSENGCDTTGTIAVSTIAKPYTDLGKDTSICIGQQLVLNAFYEGASYLWQDGSVQQSFVASQAGLYTVQVRNQCGVATDSINMQVENCACKISIPNSFTPNSDGRNDLFRPAFQCFFSGYELKIFNRWGQLIYISSSSAAGWDGTFNGQPQPTGGYVYQITYKDELTKKSIRKSGTLLLVR